MNPRQNALVRLVLDTLNARTGEPKYETVYDDEVPATFKTPSIYIPPIQYGSLPGSMGYSQQQAICTLVIYRETRKKAHWDAYSVMDALQVKRNRLSFYDGNTKSEEQFHILDAQVRIIEGGPTNVKAATLTVTWRAMIEQDLDRDPFMQSIENEAFYRAEEVAGTLSYEADSQSNEVKSPMTGQTILGQDTL